MRTPLPSILALALACTMTSCSDDGPVGPGSGGVESSYSVNLEVFSAGVDRIDGTAADDVYAYAGMLLHYDGYAWKPVKAVPEMSGLRDIAVNEVGAVTMLDTWALYRFRDGEWEKHSLPSNRQHTTLLSDGSVVVIAGDNRTYMHDGSTWSAGSFAFGGDVVQVVGPSLHDLYALGWGGMIARYTGNEWSTAFLDSFTYFPAAWKLEGLPLHVWALESLYEFGGAGLTPAKVDAADTVIEIRDMWGSADSGAYALARSNFSLPPVLLRRDGDTWTQPRTLSQFAYTGWTAPDGTTILGVEDGIVRVRDNDEEYMLGGAGAHNRVVRLLWRSPEGEVFAVGRNAFRRDGDTWTDLDKLAITAQIPAAISGTNSRDVYAVGSGMILYYDGSRWTWESGAFQRALTDVWCGMSETLAVGRDGAILRKSGPEWELMVSPTPQDILSVCGWDGGAVASSETHLLRYDGRVWRTEPSPVAWGIRHLFAFGPDAIYGVGGPDEICIYDGRTWRVEDLPRTTDGWESIDGTSPRDVYVANQDGNVAHYDGDLWSLLPRYFLRSTNSICVLPGREFLLASDMGIIRYRR